LQAAVGNQVWRRRVFPAKFGLTGPDGKAVVSSFGTRVGAHGTLCCALGPAKENNDALESLKGYIVWGRWELKRKFRLNSEFQEKASAQIAT